VADNGISRIWLHWRGPAQRIARRDVAAAPVNWRTTLRTRLLVCAGVLAFWTVAIEGRLVYLQVIAHADMMARADRQQLRTVPLPAKRGEILDRNGHVLAYSVDADTIAAEPTEVQNPDRAAALICRALDDCDARQRQVMAERLAK
jgi:stage V sporulation protein D (sporulation-specific penicillin-binding protein)